MRPRQTIGSERRLRVRLAQRPSDRQARAALGAASRQNLAASDRLHPSAKPVRARAFNFRRLISAFHDDNLCWRSGERGAKGTMPGKHAEKPYIRARYGARVNARSERHRNSRRRE